MLIRVIFNNILSFGEQTEFNMLSAPRYTDHQEHKKKFENINILKFSAIYGSNGAGKSNLINAISLFKQLIKNTISINKINNARNKFRDKETPQLLAVEFISKGKRYLYAVELLNNIVSVEELYTIDKNNNQQLLFKRETNKETMKSTIESILLDLNDMKDSLIVEFFIDNIIKSNVLALEKFSELKNDKLDELKNVMKWFDNVIIITPDSHIPHIPYLLNKNKCLQEYFNDSIKSFNVGIDSIELTKADVEDVIEDKDHLSEIKETLDKDATKMIVLKDEEGNTITVVKEEENNETKYNFYAFETLHSNGDKVKSFNFSEESDGTQRLFDLLSAFHDIVNQDKVIIIDEVERSIHPVLIKKVLEKITLQQNIRGQFIFTTHESNLLDLSLLRRDEIWFSEKNLNGNTSFYPLSDYHEHKTKDVRRGYLQGRYGAIPFLANLDDLKWNEEQC